MKTRLGLYLFALWLFAGIANASTQTRIDITVDGLDLTRFGGPLGSLGLTGIIPDSAPDRNAEFSTHGIFEPTYTMTFNGVSITNQGWIQLENLTSSDNLYFIVNFGGSSFPGVTLNTPISGMTIGLYDSSATMLNSKIPSELQSGFTNYMTDYSLFFRIGGWGAGQGTWNEFTSDSRETISFSSTVSRDVSTVPAPPSIVLMLSGIIIIALMHKRSALPM